MWAVRALLVKSDSEWTEQRKSICWVRWWFKGAHELWTQEKSHLLNYGHCCRTCKSVTYDNIHISPLVDVSHHLLLVTQSAQRGVPVLHTALDSIHLLTSTSAPFTECTVIAASRLTTGEHRGLFLRRQWGQGRACDQLDLQKGRNCHHITLGHSWKAEKWYLLPLENLLLVSILLWMRVTFYVCDVCQENIMLLFPSCYEGNFLCLCCVCQENIMLCVFVYFQHLLRSGEI